MTFNEIILDKNNKIITKYGSPTTEDKPKVLYIRSKAKITPFINKLSFETDINNIKNTFLKYIDTQIKKNKNFNNKYLSNIDMSSKSITHGKISFLRYDVYIKPIKQKTLMDNKKLFERFSYKLDQKLDKLLNKYGICCV